VIRLIVLEILAAMVIGVVLGGVLRRRAQL
jgi:hypothetical protein